MAYSSDYFLATTLQKQFDDEAKVGNNRAIGSKSKIMHPDDENIASKRSNSTSLVDPNWELIDPTPDVHALFMAFNKRFFWNRLQAVEVSWSRRMYSCAGVCSYESKSGMCSVRLSEPLLKLRPRSDLVETLLHEMIHAYLFVTKNNRDREGHGPEFHNHMYRINKEAGTNITVYHNFNDEVKLYLKHWWRCNGPCQRKPPFYGMVKRSMNRAPGPNDLWWANHQATCGGTFHKIREPEKVAKKVSNKTTAKVVKPVNSQSKGAGIYKYLTPVGSGTVTEGLPPPKSGTVIKGLPPLTGGGPSSSNNRSVFSPTSGNSNSFPSRNGTSAFPKINTLQSTSKVETDTKAPDMKNQTTSPVIAPFSGKGYKLGECGHRETARPLSRLLTLYDEHNRNARKEADRIAAEKNSTSSVCPKCKGCPKTKNSVMPESSVLPAVTDVINFNEVSDDDIPDVDQLSDVTLSDSDFASCPMCSQEILRDDMSRHLETCDILNETLVNLNSSDSDDDESDNAAPRVRQSENAFPCPCCSKMVPESMINQHLDECLSLLAINEMSERY